MSITRIPFELNHKPGVIEVQYEPIQSIEDAGFDLLAGFGFDVNMAVGYPSMRAYVAEYAGSGYYTASAWIQVVTRREFVLVESDQPVAISSSVDVNPTFEELGVPFFAMGFPAEIFDAPCNNLGEAGKLEWVADTFFVTMPSRINNHSVHCLAGFRWGYTEYDQKNIRYVEILPLDVSNPGDWEKHLPLLRSHFNRWIFA
jgi:hypothetical protein